MSRTHRTHAAENKRRDTPPWMYRRQSQEDMERWQITVDGILALEETEHVPYEDADQRLGGHDNPYERET